MRPTRTQTNRRQQICKPLVRGTTPLAGSRIEATQWDGIITKDANPHKDTNPDSSGENMSLYDALKSLPADKRLKYEDANGTSAEIDVEVTAAGGLYAVLRAQAPDSMGQPRATSRGYAISARADC